MNKIGWYDVKKKSKYLVRRIFYNGFIQLLFSLTITSYIKFVFITSRKTIYNKEVITKLAAKNESAIVAAWHARVFISLYGMSAMQKLAKGYKLTALASGHGDGRVLSSLINMFNVTIIHGSTRRSNKKKKGITIGNFRKILKYLKQNKSILFITPDGPRGPRYKINGHLISLAQISGIPIIPVSCSIGRRKIFNSWDKFIFPFPFSKISFCIGNPIYAGKNLSEEELNLLTKKTIEAINNISKESDNVLNIQNHFE